MEDLEPLYFHPGQQEVQEAPPAAEAISSSEEAQSPPLSGSAYRSALRRASLAARLEQLGRESPQKNGEETETASDEFKGYIDHATLDFYPGALRALGASPVLEPIAPRSKRKQPETAGPGWFEMPRATSELRRDARVVEARGYANPKRFYKKTDKLSEFAQLGTVVAGPFDKASETLTKRQRRTTLTAELLADRDAKAYAKRKYNDLQAAKQPLRHNNKSSHKAAARMRRAKKSLLATAAHRRLRGGGGGGA